MNKVQNEWIQPKSTQFIHHNAKYVHFHYSRYLTVQAEGDEHGEEDDGPEGRTGDEVNR